MLDVPGRDQAENGPIACFQRWAADLASAVSATDLGAGEGKVRVLAILFSFGLQMCGCRFKWKSGRHLHRAMSVLAEETRSGEAGGQRDSQVGLSDGALVFVF